MSLRIVVNYLDSKQSPHRVDKQLSFELHDLLTDDADWNGEFWDFEAMGLLLFASKIERLFNESPHGISFEAIWPPDRAESVLHVSLGQLLEALRSNKVGTKTRYIARKSNE